MGLLEVSGKASNTQTKGMTTNNVLSESQVKLVSTNNPHPSYLQTSDSDESDSIDLTCKEDAPSSPSNVAS